MASGSIRLPARGKLYVPDPNAPQAPADTGQPVVTFRGSVGGRDVLYPRVGGLIAAPRSVSRIVKPFLDVQVEPRETVIPRPLLPGEDSEAFIIWGKAARFLPDQQMTQPTTAEPGDEQYAEPGAKVEMPKKKQPADAYVYVEQRRVTEKIKVYDPDDDETWVEVDRMVLIQMRDVQDGQVITWIFDNPAPTAP